MVAGVFKKAVSRLLLPTSVINATKEEKGCKAARTAHGHKGQRGWDIADNRGTCDSNTNHPFTPQNTERGPDLLNYFNL